MEIEYLRKKAETQGNTTTRLGTPIAQRKRALAEVMTKYVQEEANGQNVSVELVAQRKRELVEKKAKETPKEDDYEANLSEFLRTTLYRLRLKDENEEYYQWDPKE
jgi:hypothetical protein